MNNGDMPAGTPTSEVFEHWIDQRDTTKGSEECLGLTKREHFAGLAMKALIAGDKDDTLTWEDVAEGAIKGADALLAALEEDK